MGLCEQYKRHWNKVSLADTLSDGFIAGLIRYSYSLVAAKLPEAFPAGPPREPHRQALRSGLRTNGLGSDLFPEITAANRGAIRRNPCRMRIHTAAVRNGISR